MEYSDDALAEISYKLNFAGDLAVDSKYRITAKSINKLLKTIYQSQAKDKLNGKMVLAKLIDK